MEPTGAGVGSIIIGLLMVMALATVVFLFGVWAVSNFRRGRVEEETSTSFADRPAGADDQRELAEVQERERAVGAEGAAEQASGRPMRRVSQTPDRMGERPVDADHDRGVAPRDEGAAPADKGSNPL
jgi:hypothetical protein